MKQRLLLLLASISLASSLAFVSLSATAATAAPNPPLAGPASPVAVVSAAEPFAAADSRPSSHLFDQHELAELAALESGHPELQEQKAGALSPRAGGILVLLIVLVLVL